MKDVVIKIEGVSKTFRIPHQRYNSLKEHVVNFWRPRTFEEFKALDDVSFEVKKGEFLGIIGRNGSGKSTLLKVIAGIYMPDQGRLKVHGGISPFIELGVGFNPELTARGNVYLNGVLLGLTRREINKKFDEIINFAELEKFVDQKLKNFSSGMQVRLAFSIAIQAHAEILLLDEVLAVGDANFQQKCFKVFEQLRGKKTIVFVSHDLTNVEKFCNRVILMSQNKIVCDSTPIDCIKRYQEILNS